MEWAILCVFGFSFWVDRTYVFPDIFFLGIELMCFQPFFGGQNLCVSRYFLFEVDRTYVFPDIFLKGTIYIFTEMDWT